MDENDTQTTQYRAALKALVFPTYFVVAFALCYISAFHHPQPHHVKVGVVGSAAQVGTLQQQVAAAADDAFDVRIVPTVAQATHLVRDRDLSGAFVPAATGGGGTILVAGADGASLTGAVEALFRGLTDAEQRALTVHDVRPLPPGDLTGTAVFYFLIICTLGGYLTVTILGQAAPALRPRRRYPLIAAAALATPIVVYLIGGVLLGAYHGSVGAILGLIGVGALYALVVGLIARLLQVAFGPWAIYAMMAVFVFLNFPSSGGAFPGPMLPGFWRFLHGFWIGAPAMDAMRSALYFGGAGVGTDLLKLLAWLVVVSAVLFLPISRKLEREREREDVGAAERAAAPIPG